MELLLHLFHPCKSEFATTGQDGRLIIWNLLEPDTEKVIDIGKGWVENVSWSPDGNFVATSLSKTVFVYSSSGEEVWRTSDHQSTVSTIAWTKHRGISHSLLWTGTVS